MQFSKHPVTGEPVGFFGVFDGRCRELATLQSAEVPALLTVPYLCAASLRMQVMMPAYMMFLFAQVDSADAALPSCV